MVINCTLVSVIVVDIFLLWDAIQTIFYRFSEKLLLVTEVYNAF